MASFRRGGAAAATAIQAQDAEIRETNGVARGRPEQAFKESVSRELYRSRRYGRQMALVGVPAGEKATMRLIQRSVRLLDQVWLDREQVYILLPEGDREEAEGLLTRLASADPIMVDVEAARLAVFPEDALTTEALIQAVRPVEKLQAPRRGRSVRSTVPSVKHARART